VRRSKRFGLLGVAVALLLAFPPMAGAAGLSITSFSPSSGPVGTKVVIVGTGFAATDQVTIGGQLASIKSATATHIHTVVPPFAVSGRITVTNPAGLRVSSVRRFRVSAGISASPSRVWRGGSLMVAGSALTPDARLTVRLTVGGVSHVLDEVQTNANGDFDQPVSVSWGGKTGHATVSVREPNHVFLVAILLIADWPTFHQDNLHQGVTSSVVDPGNASTLVKKWSYPTGGAVISSPAVANNVVYFGSEDGNLYAVNATTGALDWTYPVGTTVSSPTVANGVVYIGAANSDLYAIDAVTGSLDWVTTLVTDPYSGPIITSPEVVNGRVYVANETWFVLDASTGEILDWWGGGGDPHTVTAISNGEFYFVDGGIYAFHWSGTSVNDWFSNDTPADDENSTPVVWNGRVYVGTDPGFQPSNVGAEHVYPTLPKAPSPVNPTWVFSTGVKQTTMTTPAVWNGDSYLGSSDGHLYAVSGSGTSLWTLNLVQPLDSSPAVANGLIYIGSENGSIYAVNQQTGAQLWSYATGGAVESSPAVANSIVYVGSDDGSLYAFALPGGS
jgi:outer membrane protein assembly factor BamB